MTSWLTRGVPLRARASAILRTRIIAQTAIFTAANVLVSLIGAVIKVVLAKRLSVQEFGSYSFVTSLLMFVALFFEFGLFLPAARLVASAEDDVRDRVIGAALILYVPVGLAFSAFVFAASYLVDDFFHVHVAVALRLAALVGFAYPFSLVGLQLSQGLDRLHASSVTTAAAQIMFAAMLTATVLIGGHLTLNVAVVLRSLTMLVASAWLAAWLGPRFRGAWAHVRELVAASRAYGFQVYVGRVLGTGTYNMDVLMLAALSNVREVAVYTLAGALGSAVSLPVTGFANALFKRMVRTKTLNPRWLTASWVLGVAGTAAAWLGGIVLIPVLFSHSYGSTVGLIPVMGLAQTIRGVTTIYNGFLSSQALGRDLRRAATVLTVSNLVLNFALIPPFAAVGAAWASVLALVANLLAHVIAYRRYARG